MGTDYTLYEAETRTKELTFNILESSNKLQLGFYTDKIDCNITDDLEPSELMKIFLNGIKVCSYWMSKEDFDKTLIDNFEEYSF